MKRWLLFFLFMAVNPLWAETTQSLQLTANFIYRFSQFTQWPPPPRQQLLICIDRHPALLNQFGYIKLPATFSVAAFDPQLTPRCDILVLTEFSETDPGHWQAFLQQKPILVITDQAFVYRHTGIIRLFITTEGFNFDVNLARARAHGLQLSSHLLKLARTVD